MEMVGPDDLRNAVSLNSTLINAARAVGPAVAGIMIATVGEGWCFVINAVSFAAVVGSLMTMDTLAAEAERADVAPPRPAARGVQVRRPHA